MSAALTDKQQQQLAVTILAAVLLLIFGAIVLPLWFANASRQENIHLLQEIQKDDTMQSVRNYDNPESIKRPSLSAV